jgi:1,4-alpha-glucan branching enzyme
LKTTERYHRITEYDVYLFREGTHYSLYEKLGAHRIKGEGYDGTHFAVWAPFAKNVSVIGDFNLWRHDANPLTKREDGSGIWEGFISGVGEGSLYKYSIDGVDGRRREKGDPFAFMWEVPPRTASVVWSLDYRWRDKSWIGERRKNSKNGQEIPISIYEVHLGSWRRVPEQGNRALDYTELAKMLPLYVKEMGFTHVEFLPVMEHAFFGSWGYQMMGYFAPSSRYGTPQEFMNLVESFHTEGIGVILDWVPSHFPSDDYSLAQFDGTPLYEYDDPRKRFQRDWNTYVFDYRKNEVRSFLVSSASFWAKVYHVDGLRVDAVASMLYLDYSRPPGEWSPNEFGGKENLEAIRFLKELNSWMRTSHPDVMMIAEESTAWPGVTKPVSEGGLGFGYKWNMGWMHDTLEYFSLDPIYRKYHHDRLIFSIWYAFSENYILPISHDEVVYGKRSLLRKMPGDEWQKFANVRALLGYMYCHPGKKLLFMGNEFAQGEEWNHDRSLDWHLTKERFYSGVMRLVKDLNRTYRRETALHLDTEPTGFEWVDNRDWQQSVIAFLRKGRDGNEGILVVTNLTPVIRTDYRVGVPWGGYWDEILNTDSEVYGGSNAGNYGGVPASNIPFHGRPWSLVLTLPPLSTVLFKPKGKQKM